MRKKDQINSRERAAWRNRRRYPADKSAAVQILKAFFKRLDSEPTMVFRPVRVASPAPSILQYFFGWLAGLLMFWRNRATA
jgi:hypothetical protein